MSADVQLVLDDPADRAVMVTMQCRVDPAWDAGRIAQQLVETAVVALPVVLRGVRA